MTYARSRLWLGITCVGTFVVLSVAALVFGLPARLAPGGEHSTLSAAVTLIGFVFVYAAIQLPFDILGGYMLPKRFSRDHKPLGLFIRSLAAAVAIHGSALFLALLMIQLATAQLGVPGVPVAVVVGSALLLCFRTPLACAVGGMSRSDHRLSGSKADVTRQSRPVVRTIRATDEGWTGGISGIIRPSAVLIPRRWVTDLSGDAVRLCIERRLLAIRSGAWARGRVASAVFVLSGATLSGLLTTRGALGTPAGTIECALWFTLWSFLGLLVLPSPSRAAVHRVDRALREQLEDSVDGSADAQALEHIDTLGDDEPQRPSGIESVFHPVPSVGSRNEDDPRVSAFPAWWDAARTSVYLGNAAGGMLGRAVHCNCGRPELWVYLPSA